MENHGAKLKVLLRQTVEWYEVVRDTAKNMVKGVEDLYQNCTTHKVVDASRMLTQVEGQIKERD